MVPLDRPVAEVCALAKRDLKPGDRLDAIGEIHLPLVDHDRAGSARRRCHFPAAFSKAEPSPRPSPRAELLTYANARPDPDSRLVELRGQQDEMLFGAPRRLRSEAAARLPRPPSRRNHLRE